jgi:hypothetical protein
VAAPDAAPTAHPHFREDLTPQEMKQRQDEFMKQFAMKA